jgi:hypothetical protein
LHGFCDHFVVNAKEGNIELVDFYLILYTQVVHIVEHDFTCQWGIAFKVGNVDIGGKYYKKWGIGEGSYLFHINSLIVFMHVAHVRAIKFPMFPCYHKVQGNDLIYTLSNYSLANIKQVAATIDYDYD